MQIQHTSSAVDPSDSAHPLSAALACQAPAPNDVIGFTIWPNMAAIAKLDMRLAWPAVCALIAQEGAQPAKPHCRWASWPRSASSARRRDACDTTSTCDRFSASRATMMTKS